MPGLVIDTSRLDGLNEPYRRVGCLDSIRKLPALPA
jgi:hypothetical protein